MSTETIQVAYSVMVRLLGEVRALLRDAESILHKRRFVPIEGNKIGTMHSDSINSPETWIPPFISRCFKLESESVGVPVWVLLVTCHFADYRKKGEADEPYLSLSVVQTHQSPAPKSWNKTWAQQVFYHGDYKSRSEIEMNGVGMTRQVSRRADDHTSPSWYRQAFSSTMPFDRLTDRESLEEEIARVEGVLWDYAIQHPLVP